MLGAVHKTGTVVIVLIIYTKGMQAFVDFRQRRKSKVDSFSLHAVEQRERVRISSL
jgi:hypothetical protein